MARLLVAARPGRPEAGRPGHPTRALLLQKLFGGEGFAAAQPSSRAGSTPMQPNAPKGTFWKPVRTPSEIRLNFGSATIAGIEADKPILGRKTAVVCYST